VTVRGSNAVIVPLYKKLRITKFLDFTVLKDSIVAHRSIKIYKLINVTPRDSNPHDYVNHKFKRPKC
jgi:hypothetical protein